MKKYLLILLSVFSFSICQAQYVYIPDGSFRNFIASNYIGCMSGDSLDTTCTAVVTATSMNCSSQSIYDLTGIQYFDNLQSLACAFNGLSTLPDLPATLTFIDCGINQLTSLPNIPAALCTLICDYNQLSSLPALPANLTVLACNDNSIGWNSMFLPPNLQILYCGNNPLTELPTLPNSLQQLLCDSDYLTYLPTIPPVLQRISCSNNFLTSLPNLPTWLTYLACDRNNITYLPNLPSNLFEAHINDNPISCLPEITSLAIFDWTNTNIHCRPNMVSISNATPLFDTLHLCQLTDTCPNYNCHANFIIYPDTAQLHHYFIVDLSTSQPPLSYYWSWGDSTHDTIALPSHVYALSGYYDVCLTITDATGCTSTHCDNSFYAQRNLNQMIYVDVISMATGVMDVSKKIDTKIYPNPTSGEFTLSNVQHANARVEIFNVVGENIYSTLIISKQQTINNKFPSGIYFVKVSDGENQFVEKLIVQ